LASSVRARGRRCPDRIAACAAIGQLRPESRGGLAPEVDGVFLCTDESEADFFTRMNNTGRPFDVWASPESINGSWSTSAGVQLLTRPDPGQPDQPGRASPGVGRRGRGDAGELVDTELTSASPVLFSAAMPGTSIARPHQPAARTGAGRPPSEDTSMLMRPSADG
jgi:hypothetical protein